MSGRLAMLPGLPFTALNYLSQCKNLNWDLALMPKGEAGRVVRYTGECWVISKRTKHPEEYLPIIAMTGFKAVDIYHL